MFRIARIIFFFTVLVSQKVSSQLSLGLTINAAEEIYTSQFSYGPTSRGFHTTFSTTSSIRFHFKSSNRLNNNIGGEISTGVNLSNNTLFINYFDFFYELQTSLNSSKTNQLYLPIHFGLFRRYNTIPWGMSLMNSETHYSPFISSGIGYRYTRGSWVLDLGLNIFLTFSNNKFEPVSYSANDLNTFFQEHFSNYNGVYSISYLSRNSLMLKLGIIKKMTFKRKV